MKKIMKRAWEIVKNAIEKFGGKCHEYMAEALRMAWAESKTKTNTNKEENTMTKQEAIERLTIIISESAFGAGCSAEIRTNDWIKGDYNRTYMNVIETSTTSKRYVKYDFGYIDNVTGEYHAGKKDLTANFNLGGARF